MTFASRFRNSLPAMLVLIFSALLLFHKLGSLPIRQWDEARNAVSALEMMQNHNFIVRYFDQSPDFWDVKPPLLIWLQVISLKATGLNETAIRLPSALAALLTAVLILVYFRRYHGTILPACLAILILMTSPGYMGSHVARTGDHDALLVLFTTAVLFLGFEFLYARQASRGLLIGSAVCFFLGILTKSISIFMVVPGLLTMMLFFRRHKRLLHHPWFLISLAGIILLTSGYYLLRESMQPGYIRAVWNGELFPRYFNTGNNFDDSSFFYYVKLFFTLRDPYWIYFVLVSGVMVPFISGRKGKAFAIFLLVNALMYLIIISAGSKNMWYDAPLYPLFATLIGIAAHDLLFRLKVRLVGGTINVRKSRSGSETRNDKASRNDNKIRNGSATANGFRALNGSGTRNLKQILILSSLMVLVFLYPVIRTWSDINRTTEYVWDEETYGISHLLRGRLENHVPSPEVTGILFNGYSGHLLFYTEATGMVTGRNIPVRNLSSVRAGDVVLLSQQDVLDGLALRFRFEVLEETGPAKILRINSPVRRR